MPVYTYTTIDEPRANFSTDPTAINDAGTIVGTYADLTGNHGFAEVVPLLTAAGKRVTKTEDSACDVAESSVTPSKAALLPPTPKRKAAHSRTPFIHTRGSAPSCSSSA